MPKIPSHLVENVLTAALRLHDAGYWVVPCVGKQAIVKGWNNKRLTREELIKYLSQPGHNIALVLNQSDLIDVECDSEEAEANLQTLFDGEIPPTPTYQSKRGKHRLFRRPSGLPSKAKIEVDEIEFRIGNGVGALSMLPPSLHPDGPRYRWIAGLSLFEVEPAELPEVIVAKLCQSKSKPQPQSTVDGDIPEGKRNDALFKIGCQLKDAGLGLGEMISALQVINLERCKPPLSKEEVNAIAKSASSQSTHTNGVNLMTLCEGVELWHTPDDKPYATIVPDGHREHWPVRSRAFSQWLGQEFYKSKNKVVGSQTLQDATNTLAGKALFDGKTYPLSVRVSEHGGKIYIDLGDEKWQAIEIAPTGWRIVSEPLVRFRRAKAMQPLPIPKPGGTVDELRRFVNVSEEHWPLMISWLLAAFRPTGPYPVLKLLAEQGSGKTTTARVLRSLIDPNTALVRSAPRNEHDLMIAANNGWLISFDNLSFIEPVLSDALCRLATGGGFATRTLYENDEETIFNAQRPILLNGIEDIGFRSDLLDRSLIVELPRIEPHQRRAEKVFWQDFEEARPRILGALLNVACAALKNLPSVEQSQREWPRMADFAMWSVAGEEAMGLTAGLFMEAYATNRKTASQATLESSAVVVSLLALLKRNGGSFVGTATQLLAELIIGIDTRHRSWPKNAQALSGVLTRLAPSLRQSGIEIEQETVRNKKLWRIKNSQNTQIPQKTVAKLKGMKNAENTKPTTNV